MKATYATLKQSEVDVVDEVEEVDPVQGCISIKSVNLAPISKAPSELRDCGVGITFAIYFIVLWVAWLTVKPEHVTIDQDTRNRWLLELLITVVLGSTIGMKGCNYYYI